VLVIVLVVCPPVPLLLLLLEVVLLLDEVVATPPEPPSPPLPMAGPSMLQAASKQNTSPQNEPKSIRVHIRTQAITPRSVVRVVRVRETEWP